MATKGTLKYRKVIRTPQSGLTRTSRCITLRRTDREMNFESFVTHIKDNDGGSSSGTEEDGGNVGL